MIKNVCIYLILCYVLSSNAIASASDPPDHTDINPKKSNTVSISMFVPGLHQLKSKQYVKGTLLICSFIGCITGAVVQNSNGNDWYNKYRESTDVDDIILFRKNTENSFKKRNLFMVGIFSIWVAHVLDLKFFKKKNGGVKGAASKNSFNINFYYSF